MSAASDDERLMRIALAEARNGIGRTSPNPAVGAVLVSGNQILAKGHHRAAGKPHAELECIERIGAPVPKGATLYVTLEPCSTTGRTPPCTDTIIAAGIKTVVIGATDVNPRHGGRGIDVLREAGVQVRTGMLEQECAALNEAFNKWIQTGTPLVIAKCGMTLDGRLTRPADESQWITSPAARKHANCYRAEVDAILVGAETIRQDNPRLTVRQGRQAHQPRRVVVTRSGRFPRASHVFADRFADRTLVFRDQPLESVLDELGNLEITSVLIEGGGDVLGQALDARLIDRVRIYLAPLLTAGSVFAFAGSGAPSTQQAARLTDVRYERIDGDVFMTAKATYADTASA